MRHRDLGRGHRRRFIIGWVLICGAATLLGVGLHDARARQPPAGKTIKGLPGVKLDNNHTVGKPLRLGSLDVFPIYAGKQEQLGKFVTLLEAVRAGHAQVRELGSGSARVGTLEIDNRGRTAILILAGTVVKGGKQDRQISEDTVIGARSKVPVKAFCVERGRWSGTRAGKATRGRFTVVETLAANSVRQAGQHQRNQSAVWRKVAETNRRLGKRSRTGSLLATLDAADVKRKLGRLTSQATRYFDRLPQKTRVVGLAYAVGGNVRAVRWFFGHSVFRRFRKILLRTAALESLAAGARRPGTKRVKMADVRALVVSFRRKARTRHEATKGLNANAYHRSRRGYKSVTRFSAGRGKPSARPAPRRRAISVDLLAN